MQYSSEKNRSMQVTPIAGAGQMAKNLVEKTWRLHPRLQLHGEPPNAILEAPEDLLDYTLSILRGRPTIPPKVQVQQWFELLPVLASHHIIPLLYHLLGKQPEQFHPPHEIMERMRRAFLLQVARATREETQMGEIVNAFDKEGIRVLALKGFALARMDYPDPGTRPGSDLDLLVLPDQVLHGRSILEKLGYNCDAKLFEAGSKLYKDESFTHRKNKGRYARVELHWQLHKWHGFNLKVDTKSFFDRAVTFDSSTFSFEVLCPVDAIIHRAINNVFGHDDDMRLIWLYDLALLAGKLKTPDDWLALQEKCVKWRARLSLELSFEMAMSWFGYKLPQGFDDFAAWPRPTDIEANRWKKFITRHHSLLSTIKLRVPRGSGFLEKAGFLANIAFPNSEKISRDFPRRNHSPLFSSHTDRWVHWLKKLRN